MLTLERQNKILEILNNKKSVTVDEFATIFNVSPATIRRDLTSMERQGTILRSHGGAMLFQSGAEESAFSIREQENINAKKKIAELAKSLIKNGYTIFADSSSSTGYLMQLLGSFSYLTVATTGIRNAVLLSHSDTIRLYVAGGFISSHSNSVVGSDTIDYISRIHADIAFVSCRGVDLNAGFTDAVIEQSKIKQVMRANSKIVVALIDSSKFNKVFMSTDFDFCDIDYIVTDKMPNDLYLEKIAKNKCKLICPELPFNN